MAEIIVVIGAGQIGQAIARRVGVGKHVLLADMRPENANAAAIEASELDYTVLLPTWFTHSDEVDYEITRKGEPEKGSVISQKSLATFIARRVGSPENDIRENLGINKPNS